jgi:hypothetical protein
MGYQSITEAQVYAQKNICDFICAFRT